MLKIDAKQLELALKNASKLGNPEKVSLFYSKSKLGHFLNVVSSSNKSNAVLQTKIPCEGTELVNSTVSLSYLLNLLSGKTDLEMTADSSFLVLKKNKFTASIKKFEFDPVKDIEKDASVAPFSSEASEFVLNCLKLIAIKSTSITPSTLVLNYSPEGLTVACVARTKTKSVFTEQFKSKEPVSLAVPFENLNSAIAFFKKVAFKVSVSNGSLTLWNANVLYSSTIAQDSILNFDSLSKMLSSLDFKSQNFKIKPSSFVDFIQKCSKLNAGSTPVMFTVKEDYLVGTFESTHGKLVEKFKVKASKDLSFKVDPNLALDTFGSLSDEFCTFFVGKNVFFCKEKLEDGDCHRVCLLSN